MASDLHALIACLAGGLISGKQVNALYDFSCDREIDPASLPNLSYLQPFRSAIRENEAATLPNRYQYPLGDSRQVEIVFTGNTFIVTISGCSHHVIGNIRGSSIYLYDHQSSSHHNFRITG